MKQYFQLGKEDYEQICSLLNIDPETDLKATNILHSKIRHHATRKTLKKIRSKLRGKIALIFAPGPSLKNSLKQLQVFVENFRSKIVIIAVDGAAKALLELGITIDVVITDLDGSISAIRKSLKNGSIIVVHAHGDNISKINEISLSANSFRNLASASVPPR